MAGENGMPDLSKRGLSVPPSPIRKLVPHAVAAKKRGVHVFHLNIGQPDIATPESFMRAVRDWPGKVIAYEHSQGTQDLVAAFGAYYKNVGFDVPAESIQITTGGSEAIGFALASVAEPGEKVLVFEPFYTNYAGFAAQLGIELVPVITHPGSGYHLPDVADIESRLDAQVKAVLFCNPNNPTGTVFTESEVRLLVDLCTRHDLFLIADEVYREFCYEGRHTSVLEFEAFRNHAIVVDSLSKRLSACGARVGALVSHNRHIMSAALHMAQARLSSPSLEMIGAAAALADPHTPEFIRATVSEFKSRRDMVLSGLAKIEGAFCETPQGAFYLMATLPVDSTEDFALWLLTDFQRDRKTVMVAPGAGFYATPGKGSQEVRIAYVLNTSDLQLAMDLLGEAVLAYQGVTAGT
jgi:aspartate aminotransferase